MTFWRKISLLGLGLSICLVLAVMLYYPNLTKATGTITFNSITPDATQIELDSSGAPEGTQIFGFTGTPGESYDLEFTSSESPAVVVGINADMTVDKNWSYDPDTDLLSVHVEYTGNKSSSLQATSSTNENENHNENANDNSNGNHNGNGNENSNGNKNDHGENKDDGSMFILAFTFAVPHGEDGPPTEMTGSWFTTDVQDWQLIPPSPELPAFGYKLSGSVGTKGYFHMFIPDTMITLLGQMSGKELTVNDLAVFNGDAQSSLAIDAVNGGALVNINVIFSDTVNKVTEDNESHLASSLFITKEITVQEQLPLSLTPSKSTIKKGKAVQLYGWVNGEQSASRIILWRKNQNQTAFKEWKTLKLKSDGYFSKKFKPKGTATYKATYEELVSPKEVITVK